ncbi:MAG: GH1 family beta-glucosidase [Paracoccaceae bacterium]
MTDQIPRRADLPGGFVLGAATAAYQIEGHASGGAGPTHWDTFAATPGNVVRAEDGDLACDHLNRWREDLDLIKGANLDAYRFSTSWARVLPEGRGTPNAEGLDFYDRLVDGMLERGIAPHHTLYHWEMPSALSDLGGWTNPDVAKWFADYAEIICARIGDRTASTATLNEPWCVAWLSHFIGHHAPGLRDIRAAARAMHHVLTAHAAGIERLRGMGQDNLGIVLNFDHALPADDSPGAHRAADLMDACHNRWFLHALFHGRYPDRMIEALGEHMPDGWQDDLPAISAPIDWLGVNYYTRHLWIDTPGAPWPAVAAIPGDKPQNSMGWEVHPEGLHHFLTRIHCDHAPGLPLYVTENGMPCDDVLEDGAIDDPRRQAFIAAHLDATRRAAAEGANVRGFFYWSLLDNFEWAFGYEKRFGIVHVDFESLKRTPKGSYHALAEAARRDAT